MDDNKSISNQELIKMQQEAFIKNQQDEIGKNTQDDFGDIPLYGGYLQLREYIKSIEKNDFTIYQEILRKQGMEINEWEIEGDDELKRMFQALMWAMWNYGAGCILKTAKGNLMPLAVNRTYLRSNGSIKGGSGYLVLSSFLGVPYDSDDKIGKVYTNLNENNSVFCKWGFLGITRWYFHLYPTRVLIDLWDTFKSSVPWGGKKMKLKIKNEDSNVINSELRTALSPKTSIIISKGVNYEKNVIQANEWEELKLPKNELSTIMMTIREWETYWNRKNGISENSNPKKERNITDEFSDNDEWFAIKRADVKRQLEFFIIDYNKLFARNARLIDIREKLNDEYAERTRLQNSQLQGNEGTQEN